MQVVINGCNWAYVPSHMNSTDTVSAVANAQELIASI